MTTILLVEDDERISEPLLRVLVTEGFETVHAATGNDGLDAVTARRPDLMLLDLTLPDIDGLDVCRKVREDRPEMPIIMLTARAEEMDVIVGLGAGADDYVPKPFRLAELVARIRARLRIADAAHQIPRELSGGPLRVNTESRRAYLDGDELELTSKEFDLLALLMSKPDATFTREQIMSTVWDENYWGSTRTLDTHVSTLRRKIGDDTDPPSLIVTVRGVGFRFEG
ncbi:MAG: response regulator transcription factor [Ilumatobacter sp.]|uniref:response regulator transcription factor n=1 Tax=Ilumatobacter sp. TaxID=1967498 RepID=UPI00260FA01F|nr:response regulator transcription factor [Ilumatobacter sp.]MDJ0768190.1 response regulator transcription factor [Ilumatobacter sp.]